MVLRHECSTHKIRGCRMRMSIMRIVSSPPRFMLAQGSHHTPPKLKTLSTLTPP